VKQHISFIFPSSIFTTPVTRETDSLFIVRRRQRDEHGAAVLYFGIDPKLLGAADVNLDRFQAFGDADGIDFQLRLVSVVRLVYCNFPDVLADRRDLQIQLLFGFKIKLLLRLPSPSSK